MQETGLVKMLVEDLDADFLKLFQARMETVWNEALSRSITDNNIDDAVKRYCFGHDKYFLVQSMFLKLGAECGYDSKIVPCDQNNYPIPVVSTKRFRFTVHHTFKPDEKYAPNASQTRRQHSSLNNKYVERGQGTLFGPIFDESKILEATDIQANILFGCGGNGLDYANHGFLMIAFPSSESTKDKNGKDTGKLLLIENYKFDNVLALVSSKERGNQARPIIDVAVPKIKVA